MANRARRFDDFDWEADYEQNPGYSERDQPDPYTGYHPNIGTTPVAAWNPIAPIRNDAPRKTFARFRKTIIGGPEDDPADWRFLGSADIEVSAGDPDDTKSWVETVRETYQTKPQRAHYDSWRAERFKKWYMGEVEKDYTAWHKQDQEDRETRKSLREFEFYDTKDAKELQSSGETGPSYRRRGWGDWMRGEHRHWIPQVGEMVDPAQLERGGTGKGRLPAGAWGNIIDREDVWRDRLKRPAVAENYDLDVNDQSFAKGDVRGRAGGTSGSLNTGSGGASTSHYGPKRSLFRRLIENTDEGRESWVSRMIRIGASRAAFGRSIGLLGMFRGVGMTMLARAPMLTGVLAAPEVVKQTFGTAVNYTMSAWGTSIDGSTASFVNDTMNFVSGAQNMLASGFEAAGKTVERREARAQLGMLRKEIRKTHVPADTSAAAIVGTAVDKSVGDVSAVVGQMQDVANEYFKEWQFDEAKRNLKSRFERWHANTAARSFTEATLRGASRS